MSIFARAAEANLLYNVGEITESRSLLDEIIPVIQDGFGSEDSLYWSVLFVSAQVYNFAGAPEKALVILDELERFHDPNPRRRLQKMHMRAMLLESMNRFEEALSVLETLIQDRVALLTEDHVEPLGSRMVRARVLVKMGLVKEGCEEYEELIPHLERVGGRHHPTYLLARWFRAIALAGLERKGEALVEAEDVHALGGGTFGHNHQTMKNIRDSIARWKSELGSDVRKVKYDWRGTALHNWFGSGSA